MAGKKQNTGKPVTVDITEADQMEREKEAKKDEHGKNVGPGERVNPLVETEDGELKEVTGVKTPHLFKRKPEEEVMIPVFKSPEALEAVKIVILEQFADMKVYADKAAKHLIQQKKPGFANSFLSLIRLIDHLEVRLDKEGL